MIGSSLAIDTNQAVSLMNGITSIAQLVGGFSEIYIPVPVLGELRYGAMNSRNAAQNLARLVRFIARCRVMDVTGSTADHYATIRMSLKRKGKPIPENDIWIAAVCVENSVPLATADAHFAEVDSLHRISV